MSGQSAAAPLRVAVAGASGRMGRILIEAVNAASDCTLAGLLDIGVDMRAGLQDAQVLIDFTRPEGTLAQLAVCRQLGVNAVIGTTGFGDTQKAEIAEHSRHIAIVMAPNMSVGVNVMFALVAQAARVLGDAYDVEIVEMHHGKKKDAPSGTAVHLAEVAAESLGRDPARDVVYARHGMIGERTPREIGVMSLRGGDVVGEHTVFFAGQGERLEVTHRATSRDQFARGALRAALWVKGRPPGLYDMQDVLGLRGGA